jgi:hypothetical protein
MENYTFLKFLKIKKKQIKEKIKYLKTQYGGVDTINLKHVQLELLKLKNQLKSIKSKQIDTLINPYEQFRTQIDSINESIKKANTLPNANSEIMNQITELKIVIDNSIDDYTKIQTEKQFTYVGEAIDSNQITQIFDTYIKDSDQAIGEIKKTLQSKSNKQIKETILQIEKKIDEYTNFKEQFNKIFKELEKKIKQMEEITNVQIDKNTQCETIPEDGDTIINVDKISINQINELETELDNEVEKEINKDVDGRQLIGSDFLQPGFNNKYYKQFSENSIDKNIINLHNEWLEIVKNYKNKLENKIKYKKNILIGGGKKDEGGVSGVGGVSGDGGISGGVGGVSGVSDVVDDGGDGGVSGVSGDGGDGDGGDDDKTSIFNLIEQLRKYEKLVREFKLLNFKIIKLVKRYNIRYSQFFNFQKYIVNYVSLRITEGGYSYYKYISKGSISFFDSLLTGLNNILEKFNNYSSLSVDDVNFLKKPKIKLFYARHYFMIKILQKFFSQLYTLWDEKQRDSNPNTRKSWDLSKQIKTDKYNLKYFFLFNIFEEILMEYYMTLPAVANYIRINYIRDEPGMNIIFEKKNKNHLNVDALTKCKEDQADGISKIKFVEIFDPENFKENSSIPLYMGLSYTLKKGKSILILTYGYSGVGKSYTLFGSPKNKDTEGPVQGMLQETLKNLGSGVNIEVKIFELYGLGVPYKFYWEDTTKFCHFIYAYKILESTDKTLPQIEIIKYDKNDFPTYLDKNANYNKLNNNTIDNFTNIINRIDDIRKEQGRIKSTLNNPESSRSIMIYDFKIDFGKEDGKSKPVNFVVMDLPGKEDIYQTYCRNEDPNFKLKDDFIKHKTVKVSIYDIAKEKEARAKAAKAVSTKVVSTKAVSTKAVSVSASASASAAQPVKPNVYKVESELTKKFYNSEIVKSMMYSNPLWLSMIPEIAEQFDSEQFTESKFDIKKLFDPPSEYSMKELESYNVYEIPPNPAQFIKKDKPTKHLATNFFNDKDKDKDDIPISKEKLKEKIISKEGQDALLRVRGLGERALFKMVKLIKDGHLDKLGEKLNNMLENETARQKKYGYAGLEAIYINENILGLLQILANKVQKIKGNSNDIEVVCLQEEKYKTIIRDYKFDRPIGFKSDKNEKMITDNEFFSQIEYLNRVEKNHTLKIIKNTESNINSNSNKKTPSFNLDNVYDNMFRNNNVENIKDFREEEIKELIQNYDYNKIFNIKDPPIKKILEPYLETIDNFYLFFVVTNNKKIKKDSNGAEQLIDTCDKQMQLLWDTRHFMSVIGEENPTGIKCE